MKNTIKTLFLSVIVLCFWNHAQGQTALEQLQNMAGQTVTVPLPSPPSGYTSGNHSTITYPKQQATVKSTPAPSAPSTQTVVTGMIMQSILNNIFSGPSGPSEADLKAQREAEIAAARAAEEQRIANEILRVKQNKLTQETKTLNNGTVMSLKTLDNKSLTSSYVPPLPPSQPGSNIPDHYIIDFERGLINTIIGKIAPNNILKYGGIATNDLVFEDIKAGIDCFSTTSTYCPSTSTIFKNAIGNAAKDMTTQFVGDKVGDLVEAGNGKFYSAIASKKMITNDPLVRYVNGVVSEGKIAEIGKAYTKIATSAQEGFDFGNDIQQVWGKYNTGK